MTNVKSIKIVKSLKHNIANRTVHEVGISPTFPAQEKTFAYNLSLKLKKCSTIGCAWYGEKCFLLF